MYFGFFSNSATLDVITARYNLLSWLYDAGETDVFDFARHRGIAVLIKQAFGQGTLLRPTHAPIRTFSPSDHRSRDPQFDIHTAVTCLSEPLSPQDIAWLRAALHSTVT